jgi:HD-GYP domain-containing protein (c-di-GMP phosphodiesterase class II)
MGIPRLRRPRKARVSEGNTVKIRAFPAEGEHAPREATGSRAASIALHLIIFALPATAGFLIAYVILSVMGPFHTAFEWGLWLFVAIIVSLITSLFLGDVVRNAMKRTPLYQMANRFDTEVEALFGSPLREGSQKNVKRNALALGHDADFIDEVMLLLDQLDRHERLSRGHSERVRAYASLIGREIGLSQEDLELLNWTALLHDIGKLDVPAWLLSTPEKPTEEQWEVLKRHSAAGKHRLRRLEKTLGESIYDGALYHHEHWDGNGYPHRLAAGDIPLFGRITAIADAFDVMTHARSYRKPLPIASARQALISGAGAHFDPDLVAAFLRFGDEELKDVRGWSATVAGVALAGSRIAAVTSQAAVAIAAVTGAGVSVIASPNTFPAAVAFEDAAPITTTAAPTTTAALTTTSIVTTTTTATTTTIATIATDPTRLMTVNYAIGNNEYDGIVVTVDADMLEVFVDGELDQTLTIKDGQRALPITFDVTDLAPGVHVIRFDLYLDGERLSSDVTGIVS